jgi:hypothetical protein
MAIPFADILQDWDLPVRSVGVYIRMLATLFSTLPRSVYALKGLMHLMSLSGNALKNQEGIVSNSVVYFTNHYSVNTVVGGPLPLKLTKILDMVSWFDHSEPLDWSSHTLRTPGSP